MQTEPIAVAAASAQVPEDALRGGGTGTAEASRGTGTDLMRFLHSAAQVGLEREACLFLGTHPATKEETDRETDERGAQRRHVQVMEALLDESAPAGLMAAAAAVAPRA